MKMVRKGSPRFLFLISTENCFLDGDMVLNFHTLVTPQRATFILIVTTVHNLVFGIENLESCSNGPRPLGEKLPSSAFMSFGSILDAHN